MTKFPHRKKLIEKMQAREYAVIAWSRKLLQYIEGIYVAPGPLSIYHKKSFISYGGFDTNNLTEDIEATWKILSHNKKVRIDLRAKVYTTAPSKFRVWWKQRLRWNLGGFQTMWKYKKLFFNPSYGMMGLFVVPFFIFTFALSLLGFMVFAFVLVRNLTKTYLLSSYAGAADTGFLRLDYLNFNPNVFAFFAAILVFLGLLYLVFSQRYIEKTKILPRSYPIFAIYLLIYLTSATMISKNFRKWKYSSEFFCFAKNHLQLFLVLAVGSDFLTAIKTPLRCTPLRPSVLWVASKPTGK